MESNQIDEEVMRCLGAFLMLQQQTTRLLDAATQVQLIANSTGDEQLMESAAEFAENVRKLAAISFGEHRE